MLPDDVPSVEPTYSVQGLDSEALRFERKIFLKSPIGRYLQRRLWLYYKGGGTFDLIDETTGLNGFDKIVISRLPVHSAWYIKGRIGEKVYGLAITDIEFQHLKLV